MSSDIYEARESADQGRRRGSAVSQRRDEYLRASGGDVVPHYHRHPHQGRHHRSSGWKAVALGFGVFILLAAGAFWWLMSKR
jgi:hypothetical protein